MFIKRNHSRTKREFDKIHFLQKPSYERSNTVMIEFLKSLMGRDFCPDNFEKATMF